MTEFTKDCLRFCVRVGNDRPETFNIATANNPDANIASLAAFALAQMERAENAEAENAKLRRYFETAEEIRVTVANTLAFRLDDLDAARAEVDK